MATFSLKTVQRIPASLENTWSFFSDATKLKDITPQNLGFRNLSSSQNTKMYAGQIIEYTVKPVLGIPLYWMTEITHVHNQLYFIDEQRVGPYNLWHHQHHFREIDGGVEMTDIVHYRIPFGFFGNIANHLFVQGQLHKIFHFRFNTIEKLFGIWDGQTYSIEIKKVNS
jgi:ligand-binding SRPBCC domain-containing protein